MSDPTGGGWRLATYVWKYDGDDGTDPYRARLTRRTPGGFVANLYRRAAGNRREYPRLPRPTPHLIGYWEVSDAEAAELEAAGVTILPGDDE